LTKNAICVFQAHPGDNSTRIPIQTDLYAHVVLFDHVSRRKT
jgi:hypothetical protein